MSMMESLGKDISTLTMEASLHKRMAMDYAKCIGVTFEDEYMAFYHEEGLYSVETVGTGVVCLVYAWNPYEAIERVKRFRGGIGSTGKA